MKRSQVSVFIVLGLVILVVLGFIIIINDISTTSQTDPSGSIIGVQQVLPIERYVQYCVESEIEPLIEKIASQGGQLNLSANSINDNGQRFLIHYTPKLSNIVLSKAKLEQEIATTALPVLDDCINTDEYVRLGYAVKDANKSLTVTIADQEIYIKLHYPIKLIKDETTIVKEDFNSIIRKPLGKMLEDARDIVNSELMNNNFDLEYYRANNNYQIYKRKPHPYVTYRIESPSLTFNFGIEKPDIVELKYTSPEVLYSTPIQEGEGSCISNNKCYSHSSEANCDGDFYKNEAVCNIINKKMEKEDLVPGLECIAWFDVFTGNYITNVTKQNGESWCSFEQGTGGRSYKLSCDNGKVVVEQCADFKEEICGTEIVENYTFSSCRPNRFWSCTSCNSESCCSDSSRDCSWDETLGCYPISEPGTKFWNLEKSTQICANAVTLNSVSKEQSEKTCFSIGDCGNKPNYFGDSATNGVEKDFYTKLYAQQFNDSIQRNINSNFNQLFINQQLSISSFNFIETLNNYLRNLDNLLIYDLEDYLNPDFDITIEDSDVTQCLPWTPTGSNCNACNSIIGLDGTKDYSECSEYKCKSLGNDCMFEVLNGTPLCYALQGNGGTLEIINVSLEYQTSTETSDLGKGIVITEDVALFKPFNIKFQTTEEALCKVSFLPRRDFNEISAKDLSAHEFTTNHSVSFSLTHDFSVFQDLINYFNANSFSYILEDLVELRYQMEAYKAKYPNNVKYSSGIYPILIPIADYYTNPITQLLLENLFTELDLGNYHIFLVCQDRNGNQNGDRYLKFNLGDPCDDEEGPVIISQSQNGEELSIYVNEISTCKYDVENISYDAMLGTFDCEINPYAVSGIGNGSYKCSADVESENIFIKCKDHPEFDEINLEYRFSIGTTTNNITITNTSTILDTSTLEPGNYTIGNVVKEYVELNFGRPFECENMQCSSTKCASKDFTNTTCVRKITTCPSYIRNENDISISVEQRPIMKINNTYLDVDTAYVIVNNSNEVYCGIKLKENQGYLQMSKKNDTYSYYISDYSGVSNITILCYNNYDLETISLTH